MIDLHTHILPGIDDGSKDIGMTEQMLEEEARQGAKAVLATPHFYAHRRSIPQFLERRQAAYEDVKETILARRDDLPKIAAGAEVYYFTGVGRAKELPALCYEGTDILLLEMPFTQWTKEVYQDVREILYRQHLTVVLAHVERYLQFQKDKSVFEETLSLPLHIQCNAEDFLERGKKRRWCLKQIQQGGDILLASDCHNLTSRRPNMADALAVIEKKAGKPAADRILNNANTLFADLLP